MKPTMIHFPDATWIRIEAGGCWTLHLADASVFYEPPEDQPELHNAEVAEASARAARDQWILRQWSYGEFMTHNNVQRWLAPLKKIGPLT